MTKTIVRQLAEGAVMLALAIVLSFLTPFKKILPFGGSITILSMLPIVIYSIRWGIGSGFILSFTYSLYQFFQGIAEGLLGWGLTGVMLIACILLDYILAFTILGIAGIFRKTKSPVFNIIGVVLAVTLRFMFHFVSGVVIWHSAGQVYEILYTDNEWLYSLVYNGVYMLPELILTTVAAVALLSAPATRKILLNTNQVY